MPGTTRSIEVSPGVQVEITDFSADEHKKFNADYPKVTAVYSSRGVRGDQKHIIADWFDETAETYKLIAQACKHDIQPSAGVFQGMRATTGFGFRMIRSVDITPVAQLATFDANLGTAGCIAGDGTGTVGWYGLYHDGAIGAAYGALPLYLRKELGIGWCGLRELQADPMADVAQLEINGKPSPVYNMVQQMGRADRPSTVFTFAAATDLWGHRKPSQDLKAFRFSQVEYLKPAIQYRSQFMCNGAPLINVWGWMTLTPLGLSFVTSDYLRNTLPTQPANTAP